jgi:hypothetical protein
MVTEDEMSAAEILFIMVPTMIYVVVIGDWFAHKYGVDMQVAFFASLFGIGFSYLGIIGIIQAMYG